MRWAVAETDGGGARLCPLDQDGRPAGPVVRESSLAEAVRSRPEVERWVWRSTAEVYRSLLAAGVRVERCYDVQAAEALLIGHEEGQSGQARSLAAAWARLHNLPVPADAPARAAETQPSLFESGPVPLPPGTDEFTALLAVYAGQIARTAKAEHPDRMRLLVAAESAGMLVATEMSRAGIPWRADVHRELLDKLLGERFPSGLEPRKMAELADQVSRAFGGVRVRPDLPNDIIKAFARAGILLSSTRKWELQQIDHPAVAPLLEYKSLYRLHTANGWAWLEQWVHDGRFRPEYLPGGTVSGRWTTNGGGALQIPKVIRQAIRADPGWSLVVADAAQMEPRILAAISRDPGLMEVAGRGEDLYADLAARAFGGDRAQAKIALLGAIYGQTSGDALTHMAELRRRYPIAMAYVDEAARAGEQGRLVRTWLGRTCPPASVTSPEQAELSQEQVNGYGSSAAARARGRFTRNFVVQGSAADWALLVLAGLRHAMSQAGLRAELVFFQHDEVIVHCPAEEAATVAEMITTAADAAGRITFGPIPVRFPFTTAVVECYFDAK
ncbi:bifunctional 3'-5' exonuclease/DNA polymerase [Nocardia sp. NPDC050175]|uniref:bifunctional 3'-5' exonuclease/DNA polymerase n=1 Tax=Nocardia sp. NPDC050175 TaxID=3364317 RepID=UPI0037885736